MKPSFTPLSCLSSDTNTKHKPKPVMFNFVSYHDIEVMKHNQWSPFHWTLSFTAIGLSLSGKSGPMPPIKINYPHRWYLSLKKKKWNKRSSKAVTHCILLIKLRKQPTFIYTEDIFGKLLSQTYNLIKAETKSKENYNKILATRYVLLLLNHTARSQAPQCDSVKK